MSSQAPSVEIGRIIDDGQWNAFQKLVLVFAALAFAVDGIANQSLALAIPALMNDWHAGREAFASVAAAGLVGLTIGAAAGGMLGDRFGRRILLVASVLLFGAMTVCAALADNPATLLWIRFFDGLGIGAAIPNGAALISEFTPLRRRSLAIALGMVFIAVGAVLAGLAAAFILPAAGWRGLFVALGTLPLVLGLAFAFALPESPIFLSRRPSRRAELLGVMTRCGHVLSADCTISGEALAQQRAPLRALFDKETRTETLTLWSAFFFCMLASYTMFSWVPAMLASLGFKLSLTSLGITAFSCGGIAGGVASGWLIEWFGLKRSGLGLALGGVVGAILLGLVSYFSAKQIGILFAALIFEGFFISGLLNTLYTFSAFMYPNFARATGVGAAAAAGRVGAILSSYAGVIALQLGGASGYFLVIAGSVAISFASIALMRRQAPAPNRSASIAPAAR